MPKKKTTSTKKKVAKKTVKKAAKKAPAKKTPAKKASAKKTPAKKAAKKAGKKPTKKAVKKTVKKAAKKAAKKTAAKKAKKTSAKKAVQNKAGKKAALKKAVLPKAASVSKDEDAKSSAASKDAKSTPIVFSLDDVEQLMASKKSEKKAAQKEATEAVKKAAPAAKKKVVVEDEPVQQRVLGAASLADILGFNPAEKNKSTDLSEKEVPKKWKKYYKLLIELRAHVRDELDLHTADTLKHSSRDESGDLSSYSTHQADAGTDTFDRDFALSLVSSEQDALNEIEEAILRIKDGTYGKCEVTGKAIPAARLTAVPFARFSVEGQSEYEKNLRRKVDRTSNTGLFGDSSDAPKLAASDDDD